MERRSCSLIPTPPTGHSVAAEADARTVRREARGSHPRDGRGETKAKVDSPTEGGVSFSTPDPSAPRSARILPGPRLKRRCESIAGQKTDCVRDAALCLSIRRINPVGPCVPDMHTPSRRDCRPTI